jgi:hypothetical protein
MWYAFLADVVVAVHVGYVSFVIFGQLLIVLGWICKWRWVRNVWFRSVHLLMIVIVALESAAGINCPLTDWEDGLRFLARQPVEQGTFIGRMLHNLLYFDIPYNHPIFQICYIGFALLVLLTFVLAPPRRRRPATC